MKKYSYLLFMISLASCVANNNINRINKDILIEEQRLTGLNNEIDSITRERTVKEAGGKIDELTDSITKDYIQRLKDTVNVRLNYFKAITNDSKRQMNKKELLEHLDKVKQSYSKELSNVLFLDDFFKASTFSRLNTATFFGPGEFELSDSATAQVSIIMQNILKDAFDFSAKHHNRKLKAMFIVLGYADEQYISKGSTLYNALASSISAAIPTRKQLNTELSNRRAISIKNILKNKYRLIFSAKEGHLFSSSFIATGKGEELPLGDFNNYQPYDVRRRIVLLYWSILPDLD